MPEDQQKVPFHADRNGALSKCSHYLIYQEQKKEPELKYDMDHIKTLPAAWIYRCMNNFKLVEPFK